MRMTGDELTKAFAPCTDQQVQDLLSLQAAGKAHGEAGFYPDGDYSSDADWVNGPGALIGRLAEALDVDDGSVFAVYADSHDQAFYEMTTRKDRLTVKLSNSESEDAQVGGWVMAEIEGDFAHEWAESDGSIGGSSWETASDMPDFAYAMPCNHAGLVEELRKEGYVLDLSEYLTPEEVEENDPDLATKRKAQGFDVE